MIEKTALHPVHVARLFGIRNKVYTKVAELSAKALLSREPIAFASLDGKKFECFKKGDAWGSDFDCAWFSFEGVVPESAKGRKIAARIDIQGEGLVYIDGRPVVGITQVKDAVDMVQPAPGKQTVDLYACAEGGEKVSLLVDCGFNGKRNKKGCKARLKTAELVSVDDDMRGFYYDYLQLFALLLTFGKNKALSAERAGEIDTALDGAWLQYRRGDIAMARKLLGAAASSPTAEDAAEYTAIGHAHIDLGWLWPIRETKRKGARTYATALTNIAKYPDYVFGASQAQLMEWIKTGYPDLYERFRRAVADGRIEPQGAMWTENDCNLPGGESIIRQFLYGEEFFLKEFGRSSRTVWLPDVFGYPASLPQIFKKCGKDYFMTIKLTWNNHNKFPYKSFVWKGIDGTEILAHMAPQGTYNSSATPLALVKSEQGNDEGAKEGLLVYGIGDGGGGPGEAPLEMIKRERDENGLPKVVNASAQSFFDKLAQKAASLPVWRGELYLEKHQGTYTSQAKIKLNNRMAERELHEVEWLEALAMLKGSKYDPSATDAIWKEILLYQFHDIIPGSSIKRIYDEANERFDVLRGKLRDMRAKLLTAVKKDGSPSYVNASPFEREEYVRTDEGWRKVCAAPYSAAAAEEAEYAAPVCGSDFIENDKIKVVFAPDGSIKSAFVKDENFDYCGEYLNRLTVFTDPKLYYNAWDIREDYRKLRTYPAKLVASRSYVDGPTAVMEQKYELGKNSQAVQKITVTAGDSAIDFRTGVDWKEDHKMLRAEFRPSVFGSKVNCDIQFGNIDRDTADETPVQKAQLEICAHKFVNVDSDDGERGVALINDCKYGHRVKDGLISLDLLRSPKHPDPECDIGEHVFGYCLRPHMGTWRECDIVRQAYLYNEPLISCDFTPDLPPLIGCDGDGVIVETIKPAHDGKGVVARIYERYGEETETVLKAGFSYKAVYETDMLEKNAEKLTSAKLKFAPYEIKTFYFEI